MQFLPESVAKLIDLAKEQMLNDGDREIFAPLCRTDADGREAEVRGIVTEVGGVNMG